MADIKDGTETKFLLQKQDRLTAFLECLKKIKSDELHKAHYLQVLSHILNIMHDLSKIQKSSLYINSNYDLYFRLTTHS